MPNHVYSSISVEEKYADKLKEIAEVGLCRYYLPMPEELDGSVSGSENAKPEWQKEKSKELIDKYGADNWYDWCCNNWGTKWGCYDNEVDGGLYTFTTAWGPIADHIIKKLMEDIPSFNYSFEEEQGWGGERLVENGRTVHLYDYDTPSWELVPKAEKLGLEICFLSEDYKNPEGKFEKGYYAHWSLHEFLSRDLDEAIKIYNEK